MSGFLLVLLGVVLGVAGAWAFLGRTARRLSTAAVVRDAELAALRTEHERVVSDLKLLELATEGRSESVKAENAELRRRLDELADLVMREAEPPAP